MQFIQKHKGLLFFAGFIILIVPEILKVYFIMPFPGSQQHNNVELAYKLNQYIWVTRLVGDTLLLLAAFEIFKVATFLPKLATGFVLVITFGIVYITNFQMLAEKIFYQPKVKLLVPAANSAVDENKLAICVTQNGEAKAYPIYIIAYHHQVRDTVGGAPVMVTYCSVCRTGRAYRPIVEGMPEDFRLVGMDQFNAMFEDATTKSWWRQATGECCAGPLKGQKLDEVPTQQMTIAAWKNLYPKTLVLQPDTNFTEQYAGLLNYDDGTSKSSLTGSDTASFKPKSWVVGVVTNTGEKMYDWNALKQQHVINDNVGGTPVVLVLEKDGKSFHAFERKDGGKHNLVYDAQKNLLVDNALLVDWNMKGECVDCEMDTKPLAPLKAYQEFYHSFTTFHPSASVYR